MVPGRRAFLGLEAKSDAEDAIVAAQDLLRDRIAHLMPVGRPDRDMAETEVIGEPEAFHFYAPGPQSGGPAALRRYTLLLTPAKDLVLASASDGTASAADSASARVTRDAFVNRFQREMRNIRGLLT